MLQPKSYPELFGKTLVLEADPFITMVDDDNPWVEGLFMLATVGLLVGAARVIGGLLLTASLPPLDAVIATFLQGWKQIGLLGTGSDAAQMETAIREAMATAASFAGYSSGWLRMLLLVTTPLGLILQWLFYSLIGFGVARTLGGTGSLNQTLGATALIAAPHALQLLSIIPFVSVSGLLLFVWTLLIVYRSLEVAHDLPWQRAVITAVAPLAILALLLLSSSALIGLFLALGGR